MGRAILHVHTTFSDGSASVAEILAAAEARGVDVVGFADHDDARAHAAALRWKDAHPDARVEPLWGVELTCFPFRHLLLYKFDPPYPDVPPPRFRSLAATLTAARRTCCYTVAPHVATPWIGVGTARLVALRALGLDAYELLTPVGTASRVAGRLRAAAPPGLLALGGSDAHHPEELFRVLVEFPGGGLRGLRAALAAQTARPRWGERGAAVPWPRQARRHLRALVGLPAEQALGAARRRGTRERPTRPAPR